MITIKHKNTVVSMTTTSSFIKKSFQYTCISGCILSLSACVLDGSPTWDGGVNDGYFTPEIRDSYNTPIIDTQEEYRSNDSYYTHSKSNPPQVSVPQSYHLGYANTPPSPKDEDSLWAANQNPNDFTIQVKKDAKPSQVAKALQELPKNQRSVELKSHSGTYLGLHGNYSNREAAEAQLNNLPSDLKSQAKIETWGSIQNEVDQ